MNSKRIGNIGEAITLAKDYTLDKFLIAGNA